MDRFTDPNIQYTGSLTPESSDQELDKPSYGSPKKFLNLSPIRHLYSDSSQDSGHDAVEETSTTNTWTSAVNNTSVTISRPPQSNADNSSKRPTTAKKSSARHGGKPKLFAGPLSAKKQAGVLDVVPEVKPGPKSTKAASKKRKLDDFEQTLREYDSSRDTGVDGQCCSCDQWCKLQKVGLMEICSRCAFWSHPYHMDVKLCIPDVPEPEATSCFFCNQINAKTKPQSIEYKNTENLSAMGDNKPSNAHEYVKEAPAGNYKQWKFFWNMKVEKKGGQVFNIKLGDCVYIKHVKGDGHDFMRVSYLIKDSQNKPWFSGYHIINPKHVTVFGYETRPKSICNQFKNMVMTVGVANGWAPVTSITGSSCCLYKKDYQSYQPRMFTKSLIFPIIYDYDWRPNIPKSKVEERWSLIGAGMDYKVCKNPLFVIKKSKTATVTAPGSGSSASGSVQGDDGGSVCSNTYIPGSSASTSSSVKPDPKSVEVVKPGPKSTKVVKPGPKSSKKTRAGPKSSKVVQEPNYESSEESD